MVWNADEYRMYRQCLRLCLFFIYYFYRKWKHLIFLMINTRGNRCLFPTSRLQLLFIFFICFVGLAATKTPGKLWINKLLILHTPHRRSFHYATFHLSRVNSPVRVQNMRIVWRIAELWKQLNKYSRIALTVSIQPPERNFLGPCQSNVARGPRTAFPMKLDGKSANGFRMALRHKQNRGWWASELWSGW